MLGLNIHNIEEIEIDKIGKIFKGSYCRTIRIKTSEVDVVEIYLFASTPGALNDGLNGKGK